MNVDTRAEIQHMDTLFGLLGLSVFVLPFVLIPYLSSTSALFPAYAAGARAYISTAWNGRGIFEKAR